MTDRDANQTNDAVLRIRNTLEVLLDPGQVVELRIPNTRKATVSGYFNDVDKLARVAATWSGQAAGMYVTLNPVNPDLLARAANRTVGYAKHTTADRDIISRRWIPIDFDAIRPSGISSTDQEHEAALDRAYECRDWLRSQGWPDPVLADSGNGGHLLYRIALPNDEASRGLLRRCLEALAQRFNNSAVLGSVDIFNATR